MENHPFISKNTAIRLMNEYGAEKNPFIFIIDFSMEHAVVCPLKNVSPEEIRFNINGLANSETKPIAARGFTFSKNPVKFSLYRERFNSVLQHIAYGNTYLLNLTCCTGIETSLNLEEIFERSSAKYKLWLNGRFVVFSPETFITIHKGIISSFPMKGTIDATLPDAENVLLSDPKEIAEHYTIVDLIRNDLNSVAKKVTVEKFRYIERLETNFGALLQVSSKITGTLAEDYPRRIGDILFGLLPAGSISGAPKEKTVSIIRNTEAYDRGFYTGVFGFFDGEFLDSGVMIRFIESSPEGLIFKSGGGITSFSDPLAEYHEMIDKVYVPFT